VFIFDGSDLKDAPTLATGDFKISVGGAAFANLATDPVVEPAGGPLVKIAFSQAETNGGVIAVKWVDQAGGDWSNGAATWDTDTSTIGDVRSEVSISGAAVPERLGIQVYNYSTWIITVTGMGDISDYTKLFFTVKANPDKEPDNESVLQVVIVKTPSSTALVYIDGNPAGGDADKATLVIDDDVNGDITVTVSFAVTGIVAREGLSYDVRKLTATQALPEVVAEEKFDILDAITRTTT
jgi:hypothetical protein